jgi:hypothetical protein
MKYYQTAQQPCTCTYYIVDGKTAIQFKEFVEGRHRRVVVTSGPNVDRLYDYAQHHKLLKELSLGSFVEVYNRWLRRATFQKGGSDA